MYVVGSDDRHADRNAGCPAADIDANADNTVTTETVRIAPLRCSYTDCVSIEFTRSPPLPRCEPSHHAGTCSTNEAIPNAGRDGKERNRMTNHLTAAEHIQEQSDCIERLIAEIHQLRAATMTNEQPCIWQRRAEAMLPLVNAALGIADRCKMNGSRGDFIVVDFATIREMIKAAEAYRKAAEQEPQP